jgi:hypothetical protein
MGWQQKLFSNMILRNMLASFGKRSAYSKAPGSFIPYFQYKIGDYQPDQYLYFPNEPFDLRYKNEIFNKLHEYTGYDIIRYLEFHYAAYPDRVDFLHYLNYEIFERLKKQPNDPGLLSAQAWVKEKKEELKEGQKEQIRQDIEQVVQEIVNKQPTGSPQEIEHHVSALVEKFTGHMERVTTETEKGIQDLTGSFITGNIELNNRNHEEKLIQVFIILQDIKAPPQVAKAEQLFKRFTDSDLAAMLHLHFGAFKNKKINTLQRDIGGQSQRVKDSNPKVKKLNDALQEFFYCSAFPLPTIISCNSIF